MPRRIPASDECRAHMEGLNKTHYICAKPSGHEADDPLHHDPFFGTSWQENPEPPQLMIWDEAALVELGERVTAALETVRAHKLRVIPPQSIKRFPLSRLAALFGAVIFA